MDYYFELLHGGKFPMGSFYGEIELKTFSFLQIIWQFLGYRMSLSLHIFYHSDSKTRKRATVVVTKNYVDNVTALTEIFCMNIADFALCSMGIRSFGVLRT